MKGGKKGRGDFNAMHPRKPAGRSDGGEFTKRSGAATNHAGKSISQSTGNRGGALVSAADKRAQSRGYKSAAHMHRAAIASSKRHSTIKPSGFFRQTQEQLDRARNTMIAGGHGEVFHKKVRIAAQKALDAPKRRDAANALRAARSAFRKGDYKSAYQAGKRASATNTLRERTERGLGKFYHKLVGNY